MDKNIKEIIKHAKFVFISKESSREDLLEIIKSQLDFWDELEEYLTAQDDKNKTKQEICEGEWLRRTNQRRTKMEYNNKHSEKDFEEDLSWIAQSARGHTVTEFIEKWRNRTIFDDWFV